MKLTDVARASLSELRGDDEIFILDRGELPWSCHSPEARAVNAVSLDAAPFTDDMVHESGMSLACFAVTLPNSYDLQSATRAGLTNPQNLII